MKRKRFLFTERLKIRKIFLFLAAIVCFGFMNEAKAQLVASGPIGDCTWTLTGTAGNYTLTISGTGAMGNTIPWSSYRSGIKTLDIQQGGNKHWKLCFLRVQRLNRSINDSQFGDNYWTECFSQLQ
jgi:hypothetical protein